MARAICLFMADGNGNGEYSARRGWLPALPSLWQARGWLRFLLQVQMLWQQQGPRPGDIVKVKRGKGNN